MFSIFSQPIIAAVKNEGEWSLSNKSALAQIATTTGATAGARWIAQPW